MNLHIDPILPLLLCVLFGIFLTGFVLRIFNQPHVVAYLLSGIILGPHGLNLLSDPAVLSRLGSFGVVLLLFFVGMEISPQRLVKNWKIAVFGTFFQIVVSIGFVWVFGQWQNWPFPKIVLLGFVVSLSSTAVVLKLLQDWHEIDSEVGQDVLAILLAQDMAIVPMLITLNILKGEVISTSVIILQICGGILVLSLLFFILRQKTINLTFADRLQHDHEMQVFASLIICLGLSLITGFFQLSTALGAFVGGMLIAKVKQTQWVHRSLDSFRVLFVAAFFVSVGMMLNLNFVINNWRQILSLLLLVLVTNTFINASVLRVLGDSWKEAFYAGALLAQIGEFSFILAAVGIQIGIIADMGYQLTIAVITLTLLFSPFWIYYIKYLALQRTKRVGN